MKGGSDHAAIDEVFANYHAKGLQPGLAYGVVRRGALVHAGGLGELDSSGSRPDADSVFRIASITKSFTAAAALALRDKGLLRLDDRVEEYVPEVAASHGPTSDSPALTVRDLLTMNAGFPTDDAWADRLLDLPSTDFTALLRSRPRFAWAPGTEFEYSNLGYAIMGRVIAAAADRSFGDVVTSLLLRPLGLPSTFFSAEEAVACSFAHGHRRVVDRWERVRFERDGAFGSMGGLFSSVRDLSRWVAGFTDAFPPRDDPEGGHPLARATRREMQRAQTVISPPLPFPQLADASPPTVGGYGYGLFVVHHPRHGLIVGHPGGLPGFGSCVIWQPFSGVGIVALANATYAPVGAPAMAALETLLSAVGPSAPRAIPWPETLAAQADVVKLLEAWDHDLAAGIFSANVDLDEPLTSRRATIEQLRQELAGLEPDSSAPIEVRTPAAVAWWMRGLRGRVMIEIEMTPERPPKVQTLTLTTEVPQGA